VIAFVLPALAVFSLTGCGTLVRKAPDSTGTVKEPVIRTPADTSSAPVAPPPAEPTPVPAAAPEPSGACSLRFYAEPVSVPRYSREGITIDDHLDISGCPSNGPFKMVVSGGVGTLKQVSGGGVKYYPPTREADPSGRVTSDTVEITLECPHGTSVTAKMLITILAPGAVGAAEPAPAEEAPEPEAEATTRPSDTEAGAGA